MFCSCWMKMIFVHVSLSFFMFYLKTDIFGKYWYTWLPWSISLSLFLFSQLFSDIVECARANKGYQIQNAYTGFRHFISITITQRIIHGMSQVSLLLKVVFLLYMYLTYTLLCATPHDKYHRIGRKRWGIPQDMEKSWGIPHYKYHRIGKKAEICKKKPMHLLLTNQKTAFLWR